MKILPSLPTEEKFAGSYCRTIFFRGKEILSYSTTSSTDSNETILCLSIKDILSTYFPCLTLEQFIQLCQSKQINRYKPDTTTHSDLPLRLISVQQLDQYWHLFQSNPSSTSSTTPSPPSTEFIQCSKALLTALPRTNTPMSFCIDTETSSITKSLSNEIKQSDQCISSIEENPPLSREIDTSLQTIIDQGRIPSVDNKQEEINLPEIKEKIIKKRSRRYRKCRLTLKRRKSQRTNESMQWWIKKYSIEPISILLDRIETSIY